MLQRPESSAGRGRRGGDICRNPRGRERSPSMYSVVSITLALALAGCLMDSHHPAEDPFFPRPTAGLPEALPVAEKPPRNGDPVFFTAAPVRKVIDGKEV